MVNITEFWISLKETIQNLGIFSIVAIILIIIVLIILMIIEKRLQKRMVTTKDKNSLYIEQISGISGKNPNETLKKLDKIAREFLKERFRVKKSLGYSELKNLFAKQKNKKLSDFCNEMSDLLYSGEEADNNSNQKLINMFAQIIKENPIQKTVEIPKKENRLFKKIKDIKNSNKNSENV